MYPKIEEKQQNLSEFYLFWHLDYHFLLQMSTGFKYRLYVIEWKPDVCNLVTKQVFSVAVMTNLTAKSS